MVLDAVFLILLVSVAIIALLPVAVCCLFLFRRNGERDFHLEVNCPGTTRLNLRDISDANVDRDVGLPTPWAHEGHFRYTTRQRWLRRAASAKVVMVPRLAEQSRINIFWTRAREAKEEQRRPNDISPLPCLSDGSKWGDYSQRWTLEGTAGQAHSPPSTLIRRPLCCLAIIFLSLLPEYLIERELVQGGVTYTKATLKISTSMIGKKWRSTKVTR
ncbi:hypothetical protein BKA70DRAFT_1396677 [Coprinopsis sp. MPI-PUGE-AT-0042]|nr:hypothetical protein BKA70DRAFT_1396677 [Coprinopsis sp. MPI-PUGE-AT-0042]